MKRTIEDLIQTVAADFEKNAANYEPYIRYIRFPKYKNLKAASRLDLSFPMTVLVGENGCNKSSLIRALYGAPANKSLGEYWFETKIDTIGDDKGAPSCFIYGYYNPLEDRIVEVLKTRVTKAGNPDYWEPSRPIRAYGMDMMPEKESLTEKERKYRSRTRWNAIDKKVVYLDFHETRSAYDRFFYSTDLSKVSRSFKSKQDYLRRYSGKLLEVARRNLQNFRLRGKNKVLENRVLDPATVQTISGILDKDYESIRIITHTFYTSEPERTVLLSVRNCSGYSEAFAGSGEFLVVCLIDAVVRAPARALVLLDEPEVSIHPEAQKKIAVFLLQQILAKKIQIVIATHSPYFVQSLPVGAVKLLSQDAAGRTCITNDAYASEVFHKIGASTRRLTVLVEDECAKTVLDACARNLGRDGLFGVRPAVRHGAEGILSHDAVTNFIEGVKGVAYCLDGDVRQKALAASPGAGEDEALAAWFRKVASSANLMQPNADREVLARKREEFADYLRDTLFFLPGRQGPEEIIWSVVPESERAAVKDSGNSKESIRLACLERFGEDDASTISGYNRYHAGSLLKERTPSPYDDELRELIERLAAFSSRASAP